MQTGLLCTEVEVPGPSRRLPDTPSEDEIRCCYEAVWLARNVGDMVLIKTLLYTGLRVSELIRIELSYVDLGRRQIRINIGKAPRIVSCRSRLPSRRHWRCMPLPSRAREARTF